MTLDLPLISPLSRKYYIYASEKENKIHHRAEDIRICLEYVCDEIIIQLVSPQIREKWNEYDLHDKIKSAKSFMNKSIVESLIKAKIIGNKGVHMGEEGDYSKEDIEKSIEAIKQFSLEIFLSFFIKNGFGDFESGSWVPIVFSTLPPIYRAEILKKYYGVNHSVFVIDKLSKAYLKSELEEQATIFLADCLNKKEISRGQYLILRDDLSLLKQSFDKLSIANDLNKAQENFNRLLPAIPEEERDVFVCLVSMILNGKV